METISHPQSNMIWKKNNWIKYIEGYCKGEGQIQDEYVRKIAKSHGITEPLDVKFKWQEEIRTEFQSEENNKLIILTGTAGDGKTKLCRDIVENLDGDLFNEEEWNKISYSSTQHRTVVKDFSELKAEKALIIRELIEIIDKNKISKPILIAVNDGILIEELEKFIITSPDKNEQNSASLLKNIIEDKINLGFSNLEKQSLITLINLSKLDAKANMTLIFDSILNHSGWEKCNGCIGKEKKLCPIYSKYLLLKTSPEIKENFTNIILMLQLNNEHFTIRELLNLATNTLLASIPKSKNLRVSDFDITKTTLNCNSIEKIENFKLLNFESTIEVGFWGMNFGEKMKTNRPYSELNKLGFGEISNNYWDSILQNKVRDFTIPLDNSEYLSSNLQSNSTENEHIDVYYQRSRLQLYCYQNNDTNAFMLQKYTHFGTYINRMYNTLLNSLEVNDFRLIEMIILALNRVFHGRYISEYSGKNELFIPEQGLGSISSISIFHGDEIRVRDIRIVKRTSEMHLSGARIEPLLILQIDNNKIEVSLTVELFDYLSMISLGFSPNTTDPRLYKKLLILRSKLSTLTSKNTRIETYSLISGELKKNVLEVTNEQG